MIPGLTNMYANSLLISQQRVGSDRSRPSDEGRGGGGGHLDPGDKGCGLKIIFSAFWASVWSKNKVGTRAPLAPSLDPPLMGTGLLNRNSCPPNNLHKTSPLNDIQI